MSQSKLPGFYKLDLSERQTLAADAAEINLGELRQALHNGGLDLESADHMIENVIGRYALPFALGLNVQINSQDVLAPMVVEEPSVVAAVSNAAKMIRAGGGFQAQADQPIMIAQVQLLEVEQPEQAKAIVIQNQEPLLRKANLAATGLVRRGGGVRDMEVRTFPNEAMLVVHLLVDCRDAMGANLVNTIAEHIAPDLAQLTGGKIGLRILSNLADQRCVRVQAQVPLRQLQVPGRSSEQVRDGIISASHFAAIDPYRAATHNKGIMNGVDAVIMATGNDWRSIEAGAHAYAARSGHYAPLCAWTKGPEGDLLGELEMPMALGIVGGPTRIHKAVRLALELSGVKSAQALGMLAGSVGMASNLAALRALATDGIQQGHMALHARSVAVAAGAQGEQVERIAAQIHAKGSVTIATAKALLKQPAETRSGKSEAGAVSLH